MIGRPIDGGSGKLKSGASSSGAAGKAWLIFPVSDRYINQLMQVGECVATF